MGRQEPNSDEATALEIGLGAAGAVAVVILCFVLYHVYIRWAARRREAAARRSAVKKKIKKTTLADIHRKQAPGNSVEECAICLGEYEDGDKKAELACGHYFHYKCATRWIADSRLTCHLYPTTLV